MAQAFELCVWNNEIVTDVFPINGDDTYPATATRILISQHLPGVPLRSPLEGYASPGSTTRYPACSGTKSQFTRPQGEFQEWAKVRRREVDYIGLSH